MRADRLLRSILSYRRVADYEDYRRIAEEKANIRAVPFRVDVAIATYCEQVADTLSLADLEPDTTLPTSFQAFRDQQPT